MGVRHGGAIRHTLLWITVVGAIGAAACSSPSRPAAQPVERDPTTTTVGPVATTEPVATDRDPGRIVADVVVDLDRATTPIDRRLFGTNLPAWLGPLRLADPEFIADTIATGTTLLRMPGGSWSNVYNWSACELEDEEGCYWTWAIKPSEFIDFMQATELPGIWTLSANETAQSAAAAVAFFNGDVDDDTVIGVDRNGVDWGTVGRWARVRTDHGNPDPIGIRLWEVGNEVFGGRPSTGGPDCPAFGWEEVWTCDGREYVEGDDRYDGYLAIRRAMKEVDPAIDVGAVGVSPPGSWGNWGTEVLDSTGGDVDFYVLHQYGFEQSPDGDDAFYRPADLWPDLFEAVADELDGTPVAVTEYNLVSNESRDPDHAMTQAMNAVYLAGTIGQLAAGGVAIANQWNLANGTTESGTDYGLVSVDDGGRFPAFDALRLWSGAGDELVPVARPSDHPDLQVYPTRHDDGRLVLIVVNGEDARPTSFGLNGTAGTDVVVEGVAADDPRATAMTEFSATTSATDGVFEVELPAWSVASIEVGAPDG